jgi:uncharacterized membrane protein HdeD (DUF308 family)
MRKDETTAVLEIHKSDRNSKRSAQLGIALITLGCGALATTFSSSVVPVELVGWLVVLSGIAEAVHAFRIRRSEEFLFHLIPGVAGVPIGVLIATHPGAGAVTWMLLFATIFTVVGLFRIVSALYLKFPTWGWTLFDGIVTLVLGTVMWAAWVWLIPWFLGFAVGVSLLFRGWSSIKFAEGRQLLNRKRNEDRRPESQRKQTKGFAPS